MSLYTVHFIYGYGETVTIKALGVSGVVVELCSRGTAETQYRVVYWAESARKDEWLYAFELEPVRDERTARIGTCTPVEVGPDEKISIPATRLASILLRDGERVQFAPLRIP